MTLQKMYNLSKCHERQQEWPMRGRLTHQLADLIDLHKQFRISPRSKLGQIKFVAIWKRAWASSINLPSEFNLWIFHFDCILQKRIRRDGKLEAWNNTKKIENIVVKNIDFEKLISWRKWRETHLRWPTSDSTLSTAFLSIASADSNISSPNPAPFARIRSDSTAVIFWINSSKWPFE